MSFEYLGKKVEPNQNHEVPAKGLLNTAQPEKRERKGVIQNAVAEFKEDVTFEIPKEYENQSEDANKLNKKLVNFYGEIAQLRYNRFIMIQSGSGKKKLAKSWKELMDYIAMARTFVQDVRNVGGRPVPIPGHFSKEVV